MAIATSLLLAWWLFFPAAEVEPRRTLVSLLAFGIAALGTTEIIVQQHERLAAERKAAHSGARAWRLQQVVENSAVPIAAIAASTRRVTLINRAVESLSGYRAEELLGGPLRIFDPATLDLLVEGTLRDGTATSEVDLLARDGERIPVLVATFAIRDRAGQVTELAGVALDARHQRRAAEGRELVAEVGRQLAGVLELGRTLDQVAAAALPLLGDAAVIRLDDEQNERQGAAGPAAAVAALRALGEAEVPRLRAGGGLPDGLRGVGITSLLEVPVRSADGQAHGTIALARLGGGYDETDLRRAVDLAERIAVAVDRERAWLQAQEAIRLRDDFLSVASHELLTPLTPLQTRLQMLRRLVERADGGRVEAAQLRPLIEGAERHLRRFAGLMRTLLDVSRVREGDLELAVEEMDLATSAAEVAARLEREATRAGSPIQLQLAPAPGRWDRQRIEQVITHLLANALRYGAGRPIDLVVARAERSALLEVRDRGRGIAPGDRERIFGRFERAAPTRHFGGLGLGLYLSQRIVQAHGGSLELEPNADGGATFRIRLPLACPSEGEEPGDRDGGHPRQ